jgi:hypothetical protein
MARSILHPASTARDYAKTRREPAPVDTAPTVLLDLNVKRHGDADYSWEVFNAQTGSTYATGRATDAQAAELAAVRAISARTLHVRAINGAWTVLVPGLGEVPLPLTTRATLDQALAHVRALPIARGKQVHGR